MSERGKKHSAKKMDTYKLSEKPFRRRSVQFLSYENFLCKRKTSVCVWWHTFNHRTRERKEDRFAYMVA